MNDAQKQKAESFLERHQDDVCFLMPNAWDPGSAKMLVASGFDAIGTTSAGIAFSRGKPDNGFCSPDARMDRDAMLAEVSAICESVSVPVNADLESGFGDSPEAVADAIRRAIETGAVGGNIEDYTGDETHPLYDRSLAVERIAAARRAIDESGIPFVLVARTDRFNIGKPGGLAEAIERANLYREAGADCLFAPGASDVDTVRELVRELTGPLNVVMGLSGSDVSLAQLRDLGVRRVSIGGSLARALYFQLRAAAQEMLEHGTFSYAKDQIPQTELNRIFESEL
ncbi:isocitrate lyase/phosphoenolpyruvate mutase family protein [Marinobacter sp. M1N3S26]|uniref:isocitrate lyase/PEP mutase family protein n=1 Tax=Marinobacter sp. M1N3S26 TaxID=3382299 RepID=UPI00387B0151